MRTATLVLGISALAGCAVNLPEPDLAMAGGQ
jgi:hypothetical protein